MRDAYRSRLKQVGEAFSPQAIRLGTYEWYDYQTDPKDYCTFPTNRITNWWGDKGDQLIVVWPVGDKTLKSMAPEIIADWPGLARIEKAVFHIRPIDEGAKTMRLAGTPTIVASSGERGSWNGYRPGYNVMEWHIEDTLAWRVDRYGKGESDYHYYGNCWKLLSVDLESNSATTLFGTIDGYVAPGESFPESPPFHWSYVRTYELVNLDVQGHADLPEQLDKFDEFDSVSQGNWPISEAEDDPQIGWAYQIRRKEDTSFFSNPSVNNPLHRAYSQAVSNVPKGNSNSYQNVFAAFSAIKGVYSVMTGGISSTKAYKAWKSKFKGSAVAYAKHVRDSVRSGNTKEARKAAKAAWDTFSDGWLTNRYVISTTKMDIGEYAEYAIDTLEQDQGKRKSYGSVVENGCRFNCKVVFQPFQDMGLAGTLKTWWEYGFFNPRYTVWDSIPFSFMVDWFLPIGDTLEAMDDSMFLNPLYLGLDTVTYSIKYVSEGISCKYEVYTRWPGRAFNDVIPVGSTNDGSTNTTIKDHYKQAEDKRTAKRVIDAATIFL